MDWNSNIFCLLKKFYRKIKRLQKLVAIRPQQLWDAGLKFITRHLVRLLRKDTYYAYNINEKKSKEKISVLANGRG